MLRFLSILCWLTALLPLAVQAQTAPMPELPGLQVQAAPSSNSEVLVVQLPQAGLSGLQQAVQLLAARGYSIRHTDTSLLTLTTDPVLMRSAGLFRSQSILLVAVTMVGNQALLRGFRVDQSENTAAYQMIVTRADEREWGELESIAHALGTLVRYGTPSHLQPAR